MMWVAMRIYMLLDKAHFKVVVIMSDRNKRLIPIVLSRLVLTKSWLRNCDQPCRFMFYGTLLIYLKALASENEIS